MTSTRCSQTSPLILCREITKIAQLRRHVTVKKNYQRPRVPGSISGRGTFFAEFILL